MFLAEQILTQQQPIQKGMPTFLLRAVPMLQGLQHVA
jgi:hypothetical protein